MRNTHIDALKGLAIVLVVLGHSVQTSYANFDANPVFRIIYSFHMPLFMFSSGYVLSIHYPKFLKLEYLYKRVFRLLVPFFAWYIIGYFLIAVAEKQSLGEYIKALWLTPEFGLWFLWALFFNTFLLWMVTKLTNILKLNFFEDIFLVLVAVGIKLIPFSVLGFYLVKWYFLFFVAGFLIYRYRDELSGLKKFVYIVSLVIFPVFVFFWMRSGNPTFISGPTDPFNTIIISFYNLAVPFLGIGFVSGILSLVPQFPVYKLFSRLGNYTLDLYAISNMFFAGFGYYFLTSFYVDFGKAGIRVIEETLLILGLSLLITHIFIRRFKITKLIFLGV